MPMPLLPMPWIRGAEPAQHYTRGLAIGAQVGEANARMAMAAAQLQAQQEQNAREADLKEKQIEQNARLESQRNAITEAYHTAQIGLEQQRIKSAKESLDFKVKQNAAALMAEEDYSRRRAAYVSQGMEPVEAGIRAALETPGFTKTGGQVASLGGAWARMADLPADMAEGEFKARPLEWEAGGVVPGAYTIPGRGGRPLVRSVTGSTSALASELRDLERQAEVIREQLANPRYQMMPNSEEWTKERKARLSEIERQQEELRAPYRSTGGVTGGATTATHIWDPKQRKIVPRPKQTGY